MIDTNIESLAIKAEIKQRLRNEMENSISEDDMKFVLKTFDDVSSRFRFSRKADRKNRQGMLYSLDIKGVMNP